MEIAIRRSGHGDCPLADADQALLRLARAVGAAGYGFVAPSPATHARVNSRPGADSAVTLRDIFGWSRPFRRDGVPPDIFALMEEGGVLQRHGDRWRSLVRLSSLAGTLFFHSAYPTTAPDAVFFGPDTYRFAGAIMAHLKHAGPIARAADICSGAGPGGIVIAQACPQAEVLLTDINPAAIRFSRLNAALAGTPRVSALQGDLLSATCGAFDLIVANPPYLVDPAERIYRHGGGRLGARLSLAILDGALRRLAPGGTLLLYTGSAIVEGEDALRRAAAARLAGEDAVWSYVELDPDVFGEELAEPVYSAADRIAAVLLTVNFSKVTHA